MTSDFKSLTDQQKAISALKSLTIERFELEQQQEIRMYEIQLEFQKKFELLHEKQNKIIHGSEVSQSDCDKYLSLEIGEDSKENEEDLNITYEKGKGLVNFWMQVLKNSKHTNVMIRPGDEPILEHLTNVSVKQIDPENPFSEYPDFKDHGIIVEFHFSENSYFTNRVLYKYFRLESKFNPKESFEYEGFIPVSVNMSEIKWKEGKNITLKEIKKTQKNKKTKQVRIVTKIEKVESFFNFFTEFQDSDIPEIQDKEEKELIKESIMLSEYDLVTHIQSEVLPKAVLYYLDEVFEDEDEDEGEEDDDTCEESDEESELALKSNPRKKADGFLSTSPRHKH